MKDHCHRKEAYNTGAQLLCEFSGLSVVVEDQEFVNPELHKKDKEVDDVQNWHTRGESDGDEDSEKNLGISDLKNKSWTSVKILIVILDNLASFSCV